MSSLSLPQPPAQFRDATRKPWVNRTEGDVLSLSDFSQPETFVEKRPQQILTSSRNLADQHNEALAPLGIGCRLLRSFARGDDLEFLRQFLIGLLFVLSGHVSTTGCNFVANS